MLTQEQIDLAKKLNYFCDSRFLSGRIMEYDLRAANISMCRKYGLMNDEDYHYWLSADKQQREKFIGWQIRKEKEDNKKSSILEGSSTYKTIHDGIIEAKLKLFEMNNIQPNEVVRIANDAVYVNRPSNLLYTKFDDFVEFRLKMVAESVIKLSSTLMIFFWNDINGLNIEAKGIDDSCKSLHQNYMLSFIGSVLLTYERAGVVDAIHLLEEFYDDYIHRRLDINFYRELNSSSMFKIINSGYYMVDVLDVNLIDISYNGEIIRELWKILMTKYR